MKKTIILDDLDRNSLMEDNIEIETESRNELRGMEEEVPTQKKEEVVGF